MTAIDIRSDDIKTEIEKCNKSPYYFATKYLTVNGKPFETRLSEKIFNARFIGEGRRKLNPKK